MCAAFSKPNVKVKCGTKSGCSLCGLGALLRYHHVVSSMTGFLLQIYYCEIYVLVT